MWSIFNFPKFMYSLHSRVLESRMVLVFPPLSWVLDPRLAGGLVVLLLGSSWTCVIFIPDYFTFNLWSAARFLAAEVIRKLRWIVRWRGPGPDTQTRDTRGGGYFPWYLPLKFQRQGLYWPFPQGSISYPGSFAGWHCRLLHPIASKYCAKLLLWLDETELLR